MDSAMKFMFTFLFLNYIVLIKSSLPIVNPGGIGGIFKGPNSETIIKGPDGSLITSQAEGGQVASSNIHKTEIISGILETETVNPNSLIGQNLASDLSEISLTPKPVSTENVVIPQQEFSSSISPLSVSSTIQPELITLKQPELVKITELHTRLVLNNEELVSTPANLIGTLAVDDSNPDTQVPVNLTSTVLVPQITGNPIPNIIATTAVNSKIITETVPLINQTKLSPILFLNPLNDEILVNPGQLDKVVLQQSNPIKVQSIQDNARLLINVESSSLAPLVAISGTENVNPGQVTISPNIDGGVVSVTPRNPILIPQNGQLQFSGPVIADPLVSPVNLVTLPKQNEAYSYFERYGRETKVEKK